MQKIRIRFSDNKKKLYGYELVMKTAIQELLRFSYFTSNLSFAEYVYFICDYKNSVSIYDKTYRHLSICFKNFENDYETCSNRKIELY